MSGFDPNLMSSTSSFTGANSIGAMEATKSTANMLGADNPFMAKAIQMGGNRIGAEQAAMMAQQSSGMGAEGVANAIGASYEPGSAGSAIARSMYGNPTMNPMQMMMANKALGGISQQQAPQAPQLPQEDIRRGQQVNVSDGITALLAPKLKKKQPISLL